MNDDQPWANLIIWDEKQYETRSYDLTFRGTVAVFATKKLTRLQKNLVQYSSFFACAVMRHASAEGLPLGAIIGTVDIVGVIETTSAEASLLSAKELAFGDYAEGRYAFKLDNPREFKTPIPMAGRQGWWYVEISDLPEYEAGNPELPNAA